MMRSISIFVAAVACLFATGASAGTGKPLSDIDKAEIRSIVEKYVQPYMTALNSITLESSSNPGHACQLAHDTEQQAAEMNGRIADLRTRLTAEGKTTDVVDEMVTNVEDMTQHTHNLEKGVCDGSLTKVFADADGAKMRALLSAYMTDVKAVEAAYESGDSEGACRRIDDTARDASDLFAVMRAVRSKMPEGSPDAARSDAMLAKLGPVFDEWKQERAACQAETQKAVEK